VNLSFDYQLSESRLPVGWAGTEFITQLSI